MRGDIFTFKSENGGRYENRGRRTSVEKKGVPASGYINFG